MWCSLTVCRRLQGLGQIQEISLFTYVLYRLQQRVWLRRPYVLARHSEAISIIRQFHDGMQGRIYTADWEFSEWLAVEQGVRQICALVTLLFNIVLTAMPHVALVKIAADPRSVWWDRRCGRYTHLKGETKRLGPLCCGRYEEVSHQTGRVDQNSVWGDCWMFGECGTGIKNTRSRGIRTMPKRQ